MRVPCGTAVDPACEDTVIRLLRSYPVRPPRDPTGLCRWELEASPGAVATVRDEVGQYNPV